MSSMTSPIKLRTAGIDGGVISSREKSFSLLLECPLERPSSSNERL